MYWFSFFLFASLVCTEIVFFSLFRESWKNYRGKSWDDSPTSYAKNWRFVDEYAAQSEAQIQSWFASSWLTTVTRSFVTRMKKSNMYEKYCFFQKMFYTSCSIRIEKYYPEFRNFSSKLKSNKPMLTKNFDKVFKIETKSNFY